MAPPAPPEQRLDVRLQGSIVHAVLAEQVRRPQRLGSLFERIFDQECSRARVPPGYLTEAVRLEMLLSLRLFFAGQQPSQTERVRTEEAFELTLEGGLNVRGKIDRLDVTADRKALIIDYKYAKRHNLLKLVREHKEARRVQAGLYLRAVREYFEYEPAGMEFCTVRRGVDRKGWHKPEELAELVELSTSQTLNAARQIREGRIEADPADTDKCEYCDFSDICRVETAAPIAVGAPAAPSAPAPAVPAAPRAPAPAVPPPPIGGDSQ